MGFLLAAAASTTASSAGRDAGILTTCLMGVGIVFAGLVCLVGICALMSLVMRLFGREGTPTPNAPSVTVEDTTDHGEILAAVSAAVAEQLGTGVEAIRIVSVKRK